MLNSEILMAVKKLCDLMKDDKTYKAVTDAAERAGITVKGTAEKLAACLAEYSLPARTTIPLDEISRLMTDNVKRTGEYVVLPTLADIAKPVFLKLAPDEVLPFFEKGIMPKEMSL